MGTCYHCGLAAGNDFDCELAGSLRSFCCIGCRAVAQAIDAGGLQNFYQFRDNQSQKPAAGETVFDAYDLAEIQAQFVQPLEDNVLSARLSLSGITCAACAWLIEHYLQDVSGITRVQVNVASHLCVVQWHRDKIALSAIFRALARIGFVAHPATQSHMADLRKSESRSAVFRLGVAGLAMMQVGMVAVALHAGDIQGIDAQWQNFLRWVSLVFSLPVIFYAARPFFRNAIRALQLKHLTMDVPVSLALILAFGASGWATLSQRGDVYFDSVAMFTFFLLLGRFLEMRARHHSLEETERLSQMLPISVERILISDMARSASDLGASLAACRRELIPLNNLAMGEKIWVNAGEIVPCDGHMISAVGAVDESLLTGEAEPQLKHIGDRVLAGSINGDTAIVVDVTAVKGDTQLAAVQTISAQAQQQKPRLQTRVDAIAGKFVAAVLLLTCGTALGWYVMAPEHALWVSLSVLVVTCPCALSLATPAALTAATNKMRCLGLLVTAPHVGESLSQISCVVFDKTGTLTEGKLSVAKVELLADWSKDLVLDALAGLEAYSKHPIAQAFAGRTSKLSIRAVESVPGCGICGQLQAGSQMSPKQLSFGSREFALQRDRELLANDCPYPGSGLWQLFCCDGVPIAWVLLEDAVRPGVAALLASLKRLNIRSVLLSGDRDVNVRQFAAAFNFDQIEAAALPSQKYQFVQNLQRQGERILMVGDGLNDVPVLSGADISIAMGRASQLAKNSADAVLLNSRLDVFTKLFTLAKRVDRIIRQNLLWAIGYNLIALPLAMSGWIPPYLAAIGMSVSSLVVVLNSLRLTRTKLSANEH